MGLRQYLMIGGGIALLLFAAWALRVNHLRGQHLDSLRAERTAHAETKANYRLAQEAAQARFDKQIADLKARNKELNDEADRKAADTGVVYRDRVLRLPAAASCPANGPGVPAPGDAQGPDRPGVDTVVLVRSDALICAQNTSRLQAARDWALSIGGR